MYHYDTLINHFYEISSDLFYILIQVYDQIWWWNTLNFLNNIGTSRIISGSNNNTSRMKRKQQNNGIYDPKDSTIDWTRRRNHQLRLLPCCVCCFIVEKGLRLSGPMRERGNTSPSQNFYDQLYFTSSIYDMYLCAICNLLQIQRNEMPMQEAESVPMKWEMGYEGNIS